MLLQKFLIGAGLRMVHVNPDGIIWVRGFGSDLILGWRDADVTLSTIEPSPEEFNLISDSRGGVVKDLQGQTVPITGIENEGGAIMAKAPLRWVDAGAR